jgi:biopolymer transport protein ExbB/TolQ
VLTRDLLKRRGDAEGLLASAMVAARGGNAEEAAKLCATSKNPMGPVAAEFLRTAEISNDVAEERLHIVLSEQRLQLERNLGFIGTMGNTAPLLGLLGTVWGIMRAFHDMARTGSAGPSVVAAGVAEALFTTAAGLLVAVPAVMVYNHFVRRMSAAPWPRTTRTLPAARTRRTRTWRSAPRKEGDVGRKTRSRNPEAIYDVNMTPLIDVSLVLVVILMVATPMAFQSGIKVQNAASSGKKTAVLARSERVEIEIITATDLVANGTRF